MSAPISSADSLVEEPDISHLVTEDDEPVDNIYSEKQQRLLTEPLFSGWAGLAPDEDGQPRAFVALANVGLFATPREPPLVPDALFSADVSLPEDVFAKKHRSYLLWEYGKVPDVVLEVVSNREGGELSTKKKRYARMRVPYYVVWDPEGHLSDAPLTAFALTGDVYRRCPPAFPSLGLSVVIWEGRYEDLHEVWLRWATLDGALIPTGRECVEASAQRAEAESQRAEHEAQRAEHESQRAEAESQRAEHESQRAEAEAQRAEAEAQRAEHESQRAEHEAQRAEAEARRAASLAEKLRALGIDPDAD